MFWKVHHWILSWASWLKSTWQNDTSLRIILISSSCVRLGLLSATFSWDCDNKLYQFLIIPPRATFITSYLSLYSHRKNTLWVVLIMKLLIIMYACVGVLLLRLCLETIFSTLFWNILNCVLSFGPEIKFSTRTTTAVDNINSSYSGGQDLYLRSETSYPERFLFVFFSYFKHFPGYYIKLGHYHVCSYAFQFVIHK
jgi:hypothetical protein